MQKNSLIFMHIITLGIWLCATFLPSDSFATSPAIPQNIPKYLTPNDSVNPPVPALDSTGKVYVCPGSDANYPDKGFATRLIPCIKNTIIYATSKLITPLSNYFADATKALVTLAIVLWGIAVATGSPAHVSRGGIVLAVKIGFILLFTKEFTTYYPKLLESMDSILSMMAKPLVQGDAIWRSTKAGETLCDVGSISGYSKYTLTIWHIMDCYLELFIGGILNKTTITAGIVGIIIAALFSGPIGYFIALAGIFLLICAVFVIARTMYIFITGYIAFSFMIMISFMFIPMILFKATKKYFDGWFNLTINFFVQPIFITGYLILFLVAFNTVIFNGKNSLYYTIAGEDSKTEGFQIGKWIFENANGYETIVTNESHINTNPKNSLMNLANNPPNIPVLNKNSTIVRAAETATQDTQVQYKSDNGTPVKDKLKVKGNLMSFYKTGIEMNALSWHNLVVKARPTEWQNCACGSDDAADEKKRIELHDKYAIDVFLAFLMSSVFIYLFYSLLASIPYIGSSISGGAQTLGAGGLAMPGSNLFGGIKK